MTDPIYQQIRSRFSRTFLTFWNTDDVSFQPDGLFVPTPFTPDRLAKTVKQHVSNNVPNQVQRAVWLIRQPIHHWRPT